ncbi:MAG: DMT family transporter, partial [Lacipirellulaceae bacterium]
MSVSTSEVVTRADQDEEIAGSQFSSGVVLAIIGTFLFALKSIFIKLAFAAGAGPTLLLTVRMLFSLPFYAIVLWRLRSASNCPTLSRSQVMKALGLGFLGYYLASFLDLSGLELISAQLERLTLFTYPAMVAVLAWLFLGERIGPRIIAAIVLCYVGVLLMYGQEKTLDGGSQVGTGVLLVLGSALSYSLYILFAKPAMQRIGSLQFTCLAMIGSTFFVVVHYLATCEASELFEAQSVVYLYGLVLAFVCTVLPSFMINEAIVRIGATRTTVIGCVGPVLTMLLAISVLSEPSSPQHFAGMAVAVV